MAQDAHISVNKLGFIDNTKAEQNMLTVIYELPSDVFIFHKKHFGNALIVTHVIVDFFQK